MNDINIMEHSNKIGETDPAEIEAGDFFEDHDGYCYRVDRFVDASTRQAIVSRVYPSGHVGHPITMHITSGRVGG